MTHEIWKDVVGYEGLYQVSNRGRVKSLKPGKWRNGRILKPRRRRDGYLRVDLCRDGKVKTMLVHRLVAEAFLGPAPSPKHEANHKNGVKDDPRSENLEWVTCSENHMHAYRVLGREAPRGEANGMSILTRRKVRQIRKLYASGRRTQAELAETFGVTRSVISKVVNRETWKHVP